MIRQPMVVQLDIVLRQTLNDVFLRGTYSIGYNMANYIPYTA